MRNIPRNILIGLLSVFSLVVVPVAGGSLPAGEAGGDEVVLETKIESASIYRGEVQVRRSGSVELSRGTFKLICRDLPERFDESSLKVEGSGTAIARIIGIDLRRKRPAEYDEPRYSELHQQYLKLEEEYTARQIEKEAISSRKNLTRSIGQDRRDNAEKDLARQKFDPVEWKQILDFLENEEMEVEKRLKRVSKEIQKTYDEMKYLRMEMEAMRSVEKIGRSVVIDCEVDKAGSLDIDIDYLAAGATWEPEYSLRYIEDRSEVELTYNARISQATGEDWKDVSVMLSTARPHSGAAPPVLAPHYLGVSGGIVSGSVTSGRTGAPIPYANIVLEGTRLGVMTARENGSYTITGVPPGTYTVKAMMMGYRVERKTGVIVRGGQVATVNFRLNEQVVGNTEEIVVEADAVQIGIRDSGVKYGATRPTPLGGTSSAVTEDVAGRPAPSPSSAPVAHAEAGMQRSGFAANLQIRKPVDLETGAEPKRSLVTMEALAGEFSLYCVPRLSEDVFVRGKLKNTLDIPLLEGSAEIYVETVPLDGGNRVSDFVGREWMRPVASGEDLTVHLGIDQDIKVKHELVKKEYLTKQDKKEMKIRYSFLISVENFKRENVIVQLADRLPVSLLKEVELYDLEILPEPESHDANGLLGWKVEVAPGGKEEITISYIVKYPGAMREKDINLTE